METENLWFQWIEQGKLNEIQSILARCRSGISLKNPINKQNQHGETALYIAAEKGYLQLATYLLDQGAARDISTENGLTPLHIAAKNGHIECIDLLLKHGAEIDMPASKGASALHFAANAGQTACVRYLLEHGANINLITNDGNTPLTAAVRNNAITCVKLLLERGALNDLPTEIGYTALHFAAFAGLTECIELLLEHGAKINNPARTAPDLLLDSFEYFEQIMVGDGATPLYLATYTQSIAAMKCLLEHGAGVNLPKDNGFTPLIRAIKNKDVEAVRLLLQYGANVFASKKPHHITPLQRAIRSKDLAIINLLIQHGALIYAELAAPLPPETHLDNAIAIGLTLDGRPVTHETPGFQNAITNLDELAKARETGNIPAETGEKLNQQVAYLIQNEYYRSIHPHAELITKLHSLLTSYAKTKVNLSNTQFHIFNTHSADTEPTQARAAQQIKQ